MAESPPPGRPPPHLLHIFATFVAAGPQIRTARLLAGFGNSFRHTIVAMDGHTEAAALIPDNLQVEFRDPPAPGLLRRPLGLRALFRELTPDLLLTYNWGSFDAVLAAHGCEIGRALPHVHHEDGFNQDEAGRQKRRRVWLRRFGLTRARTVVVSRRLQGLARDTWKIPDNRLHLVENGIPAGLFEPGHNPDLRRRLGISDEALVVGSVGHLRPVKQFPRLFRALAGVDPERLGGRPLHLLLVGDGPQRAELEALAKTLRCSGLAFTLAGHRPELAGFYRAMDLFALTSDSEQHPLALLEAMCSGLPAVCTEVGDIRSILPEEQLVFLAPLDSHPPEPKLSRQFEELLGDKELRARLGRLNRDRVLDRYTFESMFQAYRQIYEAALRQGKGD